MKRLAPYRGTLFRLALTNAFLVGLVALALLVLEDARRQRARTFTLDSGRVKVGTGARSGPSDVEQRFIQDAALLAAEELRIAELGSKRATRAETRRFAEDLAAQQRRVRNEIENLAEKKGVLLPTSDWRSPEADRVTGGVAKEFDSSFVEWAKARHSAAVRLFEQAADECTDPELREFAERMLPRLKAQHEHARRLQRAVY